jgi:asparagine synthase (glutamine-hydrolysing)
MSKTSYEGPTISPSAVPGQPELSVVGSPSGGHAREPSVNHCLFGLPGGAASNPELRVTRLGVTHGSWLRMSCPSQVSRDRDENWTITASVSPDNGPTAYVSYPVRSSFGKRYGRGGRMAFIHGEVSWVDPPAVVHDGVLRMQAAVASYPWASSRLQEVTSQASCCVLAVQNSPDEVAADSGPRREPSESLHLVADVRLHERETLAGWLRVRPAEARSMSDASIVELAYRRWASDCADQLLGDGAFALWDARTQALMCWRDPAGTRPLYYHHEPGRRLVFSSDLQSMAAHPRISPTLDLAYVRGLLDAGGSLEHPIRTLLSGVRKLPAAYYLIVSKSGIRLQRYWDPERVTEQHDRDDGDYIEELRSLLVRAVSCRLPDTAQRVGAHLSGGLDSSSISLLASRELRGNGRKFTAFSWAPSWEDVAPVEGDERHLVEAAVRFGSVELRYARLRASDLVDVICRDLALMPTTTLHYEFATSRDAAAQGIRTMLSGWGGDESVAFNGRGYFADLARRGRFPTIQHELRRRANIHGGSVRGAWKSRVVIPLLPDAALQRLGWLGTTVPAVWPGELHPEFVRCLHEAEPLVMPALRERPGVRQTQLRLLEQGHLQYRMESWASHGASLGLTYAFPLLDRRLLEFALSIPDHLYFRHGWKRWLYRTAMEGILPPTVSWNPNKSDDAMVQQYRVAKSEMRDEYRERLRTRKDNPLVDVRILLASAEERASSRRDDSMAPPAPVGGAAWMAFTDLQPA